MKKLLMLSLVCALGFATLAPMVGCTGGDETTPAPAESETETESETPAE